MFEYGSNLGLETVLKIEELQGQKEALQVLLMQINNSEDNKELQHYLDAVYESSLYFQKNVNNYEVRIGEGSLSATEKLSQRTFSMTSAELGESVVWGSRYTFHDSSALDGVKQYGAELIKKETDRLTDVQEVHVALSQEKDPYKAAIFEGIIGGMQELAGKSKEGLLADKMIGTLGARINEITPDNYPVEFYKYGSVDDVQKKLDIGYRYKGGPGGIHIDASSEVPRDPGAVDGFQLTTASALVQKKEAQIKTALANYPDEIKDLWLLLINNEEVRLALDKWEKFPHPAGPDRYLKMEIKRAMIDKVLKRAIPQKDRASAKGFIRDTKKLAQALTEEVTLVGR